MISNGITFNGSSLARHLGVTRQTFYQALNTGRLEHCGTGKHKLPPRQTATPDTVAALKAQGKTFGEIAAMFSVRQPQIVRAYSQHLIPSPGENKSR